jgi:hypothetical protein
VREGVEVLVAAGRVTEFGGLKCVLAVQVFAVRVFADLLSRWETGS